MLSTLISLISGGILRMLPEVLSFFDKASDRKHELAMLDRQTELEKLKASGALSLATEQHDASVDIGLVKALIESQKAQGQPTGIKFVDALNALVRPSVTFALFGMYVVIRFIMIAIAIKANPANWMPIAAAAWTEADRSMLESILSFWFVNRIFTKK